VRIIVIFTLIVLGLLQQTGGLGSQGRDVEPAYRANNRGVALLEQFNYDGAATAFREALKIAPELGIARVNLAIALFYGNKSTEAAQAARAAADALPSSPTSHYVAGLIAKRRIKSIESPLCQSKYGCFECQRNACVENRQENRRIVGLPPDR